MFYSLLIVLSHSLKTSAAIYRSVVGRLEDNLSYTTAICTSCFEVFARSLSCVLLSIAASLAALGLVLEALFLVEFLLSCGENELVSAFLAYQSFINKLFFYACVNSGHYYFFVHDFTSLCKLDYLPCAVRS